MAVVSPPSVAALPTPPSTASPANFDSRADAFLTALPTFQTENNALAANVFANATDAATSATTAATQVGLASSQAAQAASSAASAAAYTGAALWVTGTSYAPPDIRISPADGRLYRRLTVGTGTTDPSADPTNWQVFQYSKPIVTVTGTSVTAQSGKHYLLKNVAATTVTMPASMAPGDEVEITVGNALATNIVNPNGKTIEGTSGNMTIDYSSTHFTLRFIDSDLKVN